VQVISCLIGSKVRRGVAGCRSCGAKTILIDSEVLKCTRGCGSCGSYGLYGLPWINHCNGAGWAVLLFKILGCGGRGDKKQLLWGGAGVVRVTTH
jgi:hypothetical protein